MCCVSLTKDPDLVVLVTSQQSRIGRRRHIIPLSCCCCSLSSSLSFSAAAAGALCLRRGGSYRHSTRTTARSIPLQALRRGLIRLCVLARHHFTHMSPGVLVQVRV